MSEHLQAQSWSNLRLIKDAVVMDQLFWGLELFSYQRLLNIELLGYQRFTTQALQSIQ